MSHRPFRSSACDFIEERLTILWGQDSDRNLGHFLLDGMGPAFFTAEQIRARRQSSPGLLESFVMLRRGRWPSAAARAFADEMLHAVSAEAAPTLCWEDLRWQPFRTCFSQLVVGTDQSMFLHFRQGLADPALEHAWRLFRQVLLTFVDARLGIDPPRSAQPYQAASLLNIVFVIRATRAIMNAAELCEYMRRMPNVMLREVRFERHSLIEQAGMLRQTDLLISPMGCASVHAIWMPEWAVMLVLAPKECINAGNVNLCGGTLELTYQAMIYDMNVNAALVTRHNVLLYSNPFPQLSFPAHGGWGASSFIPVAVFASLLSEALHLVGEETAAWNRLFMPADPPDFEYDSISFDLLSATEGNASGMPVPSAA